MTMMMEMMTDDCDVDDGDFDEEEEGVWSCIKRLSNWDLQKASKTMLSNEKFVRSS